MQESGIEDLKFYIQTEDGRFVEICDVSEAIDEIQGDILNFEAWKAVSELMAKAGFELVPSEKTARKIATMGGVKNGIQSNTNIRSNHLGNHNNDIDCGNDID